MCLVGLEDVISYPSPEITVNKVASLEDVSCLGRSAEHSGVVYLYVDVSSLTVYVGESKSSAYSRFLSTHKGSAWLAEMSGVSVFTFFGTNKSWDTDSRRAIEACLVHDLSKEGLAIVNSGRKERPVLQPHFGLSPTEIEDIVKIVKQYVVFEVGYRKSVEVGSVVEDVPSSEESFEPVKYVYGGKSRAQPTVVWGVRRVSDGWVNIVKAVGIPERPEVFASDSEKVLQRKVSRNSSVKLMSEKQVDGTYSYVSETGNGFSKPTSELVGFIGRGVSNKWAVVDEALWEADVGLPFSGFLPRR